MKGSKKAHAGGQASTFVEELDAFIQRVDSALDSSGSTAETEKNRRNDGDGVLSAGSSLKLQKLLEELPHASCDLSGIGDSAASLHSLDIFGAILAIRKDALAVYLGNVSSGKVDAETLLSLLDRYGIKKIDEAALRKALLPSVDGSSLQWVKIAEGVRPAAAVPPSTVFFPYRKDLSVSEKQLRLLSSQLFRACNSPDANGLKTLNRRFFSVSPEEVVARVSGKISGGMAGLDVFGNSLTQDPAGKRSGRLEAGDFIRAIDNREYVAERYGLLHLGAERLSIFPPLWIDPCVMHLYWLVLDALPPTFSPEWLEPWFSFFNIPSTPYRAKIEQVAAHVLDNPGKAGIISLARGSEAIEGADAKIDLLVDIDRLAGRERQDGTMDFREINYIKTVKKGQLLAVRTSPGQGTPGRNIRGEVLAAKPGRDLPLTAGKNVRIEKEETKQLYYAMLDGAVRKAGEQLLVVDLLVLEKGVDYHTGNIEFDGEIYITGSVKAGFSVRAKRDIVVSGTIENGVKLATQGDLLVGHGIVGSNTQVSAGGWIWANFVNEAHLQAGKDITVGNYVYHAQLCAGGKVTIHKGSGERGGSVLGGAIMAQREIETFVAGSESWEPTQLTLGVDQDQQELMGKIQLYIKQSNGNMVQLLEKIGLSRFEPERIKGLIGGLSGQKKEEMIGLVRQVGKIATAYRKLLLKRQELRESMRDVAARAGSIKIKKTAYPGVMLRIADSKLELSEQVDGARYELKNGKITQG